VSGCVCKEERVTESFLYDSFHRKCYILEIQQIKKLRFLAISWHKFILGFWFGARRRRGSSPAAAARQHGRSQRMRGKIRGFIYLGGLSIQLPEFGAHIFVPSSFGPTLMARGSFGAVRLAAVRPFEFVPRNMSFRIWWILGL